MSHATVLGIDLFELPPLKPDGARALFEALIERILNMELSAEQVRILYERLVELITGEQDSSTPIQVMDASWKRWFEFCESFQAQSPQRSYQDILEDMDRW